MSTEYAVELEGITKTFPGGVQANKDITLKIHLKNTQESRTI